MKQLIRVILLCIMVQACGQTYNKMERDKNMITANNFVEETEKHVKHFEKEPYYKMHTGSPQDCNYEISVNDLPVYKSYSGFKDLTGTPINEAILKSGEQRITIKIFPPEKDSILSKQANMYFRLVEVDHMTSQFEEKNILSFVLPSDDDGDFSGAGLPYFEKELVFNASVPYEVKGWSESQNLSKLDQDKLKEKVIGFYKKTGVEEVKKNIDFLFNAMHKKQVERAISNYTSKEDLAVMINEMKRYVKYAKRFELTEPYTMKLYGNNRLVILEVLIGEYKGDGAHSLFVQKGEESGFNRDTYYLHIPKGKTALEIIR